MPMEIIRPDTNIDFIGKWKTCLAISITVIVASIVAIPVRGIRLGLDFAGGHEIQVRFTEKLPEDEGAVRQIVADLGVAEPTIVRFGEADKAEFLIRFRGEEGQQGKVADELKAALAKGIGPVELERVGFVGPKVGADLQSAGLKAVGISCLLILIYIGFRFSPRFAPGAIVALIHDIVITSGAFVILGYEFDLTVLAALLAILGYSLNDTIIVYDRIRENMKLHGKFDLREVLNRSVNQTLSRTLLTSATTVLAVLALLVAGGPIIRPFALAMVIGIVVGTYSSIYIASPTLLLLERRWGSATASAAKGSKPARA
ncbi:MAG: protein translocase subunit SecF [Deltaproteobacteria bacterium]|nr:protein translocase subunit SecF [Deltaproteobacteria bacterium]